MSFDEVTIDQLLDVGNTQIPNALVALQQNGLTLKARERPNPPNQFNVTSQTQLEIEFGADIEIDRDTVTIVVDDSFTMTKPFKIGLDSSFEAYGSTKETLLDYTGPGALFQNTESTDLIGQFSLHDLFVIGDLTNNLFDLRGTGPFLVDLLALGFFDSLGFIEMGILDWRSTSLFTLVQGVVIKNPTSGVIDTVSIAQSGFANMTLFSFILENPDIALSMSRIASEGSFGAGDSLFFLDPNSTIDSSYIINGSSTLAASNFYQQGTDIPITSVFDVGGLATFEANAVHDLVVGQAVVLSGFAESTYNGTFIVTESTLTTIMVGVAFVADDTGTVNSKSLDSTDVIVSAFSNPGQEDSMFTANVGLEIFSTQQEITIISQALPEVIPSTSWVFDDLERFSISINDEGQVTTNALATRRYKISYSGTIAKVGGGAVDIGIVILKNDTDISFNAPHRIVSGSGLLATTDIVELSQGDIIQIGVINYAGISNINVSQISMVITAA